MNKEFASVQEFLDYLYGTEPVQIEVRCECEEKADYLVRNSQFD